MSFACYSAHQKVAEGAFNQIWLDDVITSATEGSEGKLPCTKNRSQIGRRLVLIGSIQWYGMVWWMVYVDWLNSGSMNSKD